MKEGSSSAATGQSDLAQFGCVERHRILLKLNGFSCGFFGLAVSSACQLSSSQLIKLASDEIRSRYLDGLQ